MKISDAIRNEATKLVRRHQRYAADLEDRARRIERRSLVRPPKSVLVPHYWALHSGFNPYHVRCQASSIGYAIERALAARNYRPRPAVSFDVPKQGGGSRTVSVFQVADNELSRLVFKQLLAKNSSRLSAHCYAYRTDLTLHDAVLDIAADFRGQKRLFIAEFDFRKYFESISHKHIDALLRDGRFFITDLEMHVIRAFLRAPTLSQSQYNVGVETEREQGIPLGTSISLFLANIAAQPLDRRLERLGVGFARFADDTVIWSDDYSRVSQATTALEGAAREMGVDLNLAKSAGISILVPDGAPAEFKAKSAVDFLGYRISSANISIGKRSIEQVKEWISYLIYSNLLQEPKRGVLVPSRVAPNVDRDYVVMIFQIRRYLYGELSETQLRRYLAGEKRQIRYHGRMSFYPILDDDAQLRELDGWLLHTVYTSLRARARLFGRAGVTVLPSPHGLRKLDLLTLFAQSSKGTRLDLRLPSFARMAKLLRQASSIFGANAIANPKTLYGATPAKSDYGPVV
jgi:RNA-directed DNA polymerase